MGQKIAILDPVGGKAGMDKYNYGLATGLMVKQNEILYATTEDCDWPNHPQLQVETPFWDLWSKTSKVAQGVTFLKGIVGFIRLVRREKCRIVHAHIFHYDFLNLFVVCFIKIFSQAKTIATVHDVNDFKGAGTELWKKTILSKYNGLIVHNEYSRAMLEKVLKTKCLAVIPHGNFTAVTREFDYPERKGLHLLFFGQIKKVKGLDLLLSALNDSRLGDINVKLTIAGKPWHEDFAAYEKLIEPIASMVRCDLNFIPEEKAERYFEEADVIVLPYREIFQSGVLMKAMSHGRVVIASDLEPFREIITHVENGFLFRSGDAQHLAQVIVLANEKRPDFPKIAERALAKMNADYDWIQIGRKTSEFYNAVIKTGERGI